jgi:hypothetical protein
MSKNNEVAPESDANVLLELIYVGPLAMSEEVLDANSDDVIEAVQAYAEDLALGPTIGINTYECAIKLRFDVVASSDAEVHKKIAKVIAVIEKHTDIKVQRSTVESQREPEDDAVPA